MAIDEMGAGSDAPKWVDVAGMDELRRRRKMAVTHGDLCLVLLWHPDSDRPVALDDICIHKQRRLSQGMILNGRIVCPGHQWAYDLDSGYCRERDRYQPTYRVEVSDGRVRVDTSGPVTAPAEGTRE
jgi:nitrite reductase (NADH) small subunit